MIGGTSKIPIVREVLRKKLQSLSKVRVNIEIIDANDDPQWMVVKGGAVIGGHMAYDTLSTQTVIQNDGIDIGIKEVLPMSLGFEYCRNNRNLPNGVECHIMDFVLKKGSKYGTKENAIYCQREPDGNKAELKLYEGDHKDTRNNFYLGQLEIEDVPKRKKGTCHNIQVELSIDTDGLIKIKAFTFNLENEKKEYSKKLRIKSKDGSLEDDEIEKLRKETLSWFPKETRNLINAGLVCRQK